MATKVYGIDVSKHNGTISWDKVKNSGKVDFAILRAGYGKLASQEDAMFDKNYAACKEQGIPVGAYWYSYATNATDARAEARVCASVIKDKSFEYPIFLDYEEEGSSATAKEVIPAFLETLEKEGYYVGLYSSKSWLTSGIIPSSVISTYDIWVAHWTSSTSYSGYTIWQNSSTGTISGISGNVDTNVCVVDYPTIIAKAGKNNLSSTTTTTTDTTTNTTTNTNTNTNTNTTTTTTTYTAGTKITLKNAKLYASATASSSSSKKTGTFYIYSSDVTNNRIRITNSKSNVGKTPAGTYVTGWIDVSSIGSTSTTTTTSFAAGDKVTLKSTKLYTSASAATAKVYKTGTYYIYSSTITNNRIRITNSKSNVGKTPAGTYVSGWVNVSDIS